MAIAYDAFSSIAPGTGNLSWTHTPVGAPRGVCVMVIIGAYSAEVTAVTYGGVALTQQALNGKSTGEAATYDIWTLDDGIPTGPQTVLVTVGGATTKTAGCWTMTGTGKATILNLAEKIQDTGANPSVSLGLTSNTCFVCGAFFSGQAAASGITPLANWTASVERTISTGVAGFYRYNTIGSADVTCGYTATTEDCVAGFAAFYQSTTSNTITGALFTDTDTFFTSVITRGSVTVTGALFSDIDTFFASVTTRGAVTITAALFTDTDTFPAHTINTIYTINGALFSDSDTFPVHTISTTYTISAGLFTDPDTFLASTVSQGGADQNITAALFTDLDTFPAATITSNYTILGVLYSDPDIFYAALVSTSYTINPVFYDDPDVFFGAVITGGVGPGSGSGAGNLPSWIRRRRRSGFDGGV